MPNLSLVVPPGVEPISLDEAKAHLRVQYAEEDATISGMISAAREQVESIGRRCLITRTYDYVLDSFGPSNGYWNRAIRQAGPGPGWLPISDAEIRPTASPLIAVVLISYRDQSGSIVTLDPASYEVSPGSPGRIVPSYGRTWPATRPGIDAVSVRFTAGFGPTADNVPFIYKHAIKLMVSHYWENRSPTQSAAGITSTVMDLLDAGGKGYA